MECKKCKYYESKGNVGDCHRYPPAREKREDDWCGEFQKKGTKK